MFSNNIEALREIVREVANLDRATSWRVRCLMVEPSLNEYTHGFLKQMFINNSLLMVRNESMSYNFIIFLKFRSLYIFCYIRPGDPKP